MKRALATIMLTTCSIAVLPATPASAVTLDTSTPISPVITTITYVKTASLAVPFEVDPVDSLAIPTTDVSTPNVPTAAPEEDALLSTQPDTGLMDTAETLVSALAAPNDYIDTIGTYPPDDKARSGSGYVTNDACYFYVQGTYTARYWNGRDCPGFG